MKHILNQLLDGADLQPDQADLLAEAVVSRVVGDGMTAALLIALRAKGETATEAAAFARALLAKATPPTLGDLDGSPFAKVPVIDIVGTGGDGSSSLNISTAAALVTAAVATAGDAGGDAAPRAIVLKHGARAVSSRCGTADVLAALGLPVPAPAHRLVPCVRASGFGFLFAPSHHPALAALAPLRRELGVRTVFNLVGPLANPARPTHALFGAYSLRAARVLAESAIALGMARCLVVHADNGWDEATPSSSFSLLDASSGSPVRESKCDCHDFGLPPCDASELLGGGAEENAAAMRRMLGGATHAGFANAALMNSALALVAAGLADGLASAVAQARHALTSGAALRTLDAAISASTPTPAALAGGRP